MSASTQTEWHLWGDATELHAEAIEVTNATCLTIEVVGEQSTRVKLFFHQNDPHVDADAAIVRSMDDIIEAANKARSAAIKRAAGRGASRIHSLVVSGSDR